jgi:hypothetical protein
VYDGSVADVDVEEVVVVVDGNWIIRGGVVDVEYAIVEVVGGVFSSETQPEKTAKSIRTINSQCSIKFFMTVLF